MTTLDGLWDKADRYRIVGLRQKRDQPERDETAAEHRAMLEAVIAGDSELAAKVMREHIRSSLGSKALSTLADSSADD
ncbi:FCD domain-containing protein [Bacillus paralicheniformis]|nr:FCD domain-containing protein [Bacillus paralicheniformis]